MNEKATSSINSQIKRKKSCKEEGKVEIMCCQVEKQKRKFKSTSK